MLAPRQTKPYATRKNRQGFKLELLRRVARRGGVRHVSGGTLKLTLPREDGV